MTVFRRYALVLRGHGARSALLASVVGRLSLGMTGLAILLLVRASHGSYADAGIVSAAYAVAFAVGSPTRARAADRNGPVRVLLGTGLANPVMAAALVVSAEQQAPTVLLAAIAVGLGLSVPPLGAVMRALWGQLVDDEHLPITYSLESVVIEACFVLGPILVAALASAIDPDAPPIASGVIAGIGALWLAANPAVKAVQPHAERSSDRMGPLVSPVVRACLLNVLWMGIGFGAIEVGTLAFVDEHGSARSVAGIVLGLWSLGSMLGGLAYGAVHPSAPAQRLLPWLVGAVGIASCLPVLAPIVLVLALLLMVSGSTIAPFSACNSVLIGAHAPAGTVTEAFAWNSSMIFGGSSVGTALAGLAVEAGGAHLALGITALSGVLMLGSSALALRKLSSPSAGPAAP